VAALIVEQPDEVSADLVLGCDGLGHRVGGGGRLE
jgi:hypothetical protein